MRPAKTFLQETLNSMVNETFDRCMKNALRFPDQKRKLNTLANDVAHFQKKILSEMWQVRNEFENANQLSDFQLRIDQKRHEIERQLKNILV
ncbi:MAG: hypothetical protein AAF487_10230 [Bacteroidota bacterium]